MSTYNAVILAIAKNEGLYLLDWIAYHKALGFNHIYLYDNGSTDNTTEILKLDGVRRFVDVIPWPDVPGKPRQAHAHAHWLASQSSSTNWVLPLDIDEYLNLHRHNSIGSFLDDFSDVSAIGFNWRIFGDNGLKTYDQRPVFQRFTRAAKHDYGGNHIPKSICRSLDTLILGAHTPKLKDGLLYINSNGTELKQYPVSRQDIVAHELAQVNHYFGRTWEEWVIKRDKGMVDRPVEDISLKSDAFFYNNNKNDEEDLSILRFFDLYKNSLAELTN